MSWVVVWFVWFVWHTDINSIAVSFPQVVYFNLSFAFYLFIYLFIVIYVVATPPLVTEGMGRGKEGRGGDDDDIKSIRSIKSDRIYEKKNHLISNI